MSKQEVNESTKKEVTVPKGYHLIAVRENDTLNFLMFSKNENKINWIPMKDINDKNYENLYKHVSYFFL